MAEIEDISPNPVKEYDPKSVTIMVAGKAISGFAEGADFVSIDRDMESWTKTVGAGGEVARARTRDQSGKITLSLLQTSESNSHLESLMYADDNLGGGQFTVNVYYNQFNGAVQSDASWITKPPTVTYGEGIATRTWVIECARILYITAFTTEEPPASVDG